VCVCVYVADHDQHQTVHQGREAYLHLALCNRHTTRAAEVLRLREVPGEAPSPKDVGLPDVSESQEERLHCEKGER